MPKDNPAQVAGGQDNAGEGGKADRKEAGKKDESGGAGEGGKVTPRTTAMTGVEKGSAFVNIVTEPSAR